MSKFSNQLQNSVITTGLALALTACGSGSGSGGGDDGDTNTDDSDTTSSLLESAASQDIRSQLPDGEDIDALYIDDGLDKSHEDFDDSNVAGGFDAQTLYEECDTANAWDNGGKCNLSDGSDAVDDWLSQGGNASDDSVHGHSVASILAGLEAGYGKNVNIHGGAVDSSGSVSENVFAVASGVAARAGYPVINASFAYRPVAQYHQNSVDPDVTDGPFRELDSVDAEDAVIVVSAGNDSASYSTTVSASETWDSGSDAAKLQDNTVIVGALNEAESDLASFSNTAGTNANVQERFIAARGTNVAAKIGTGDEYQDFSGTSSAAPVVSAAIAELISIWPNSITGVEAAKHLLETADRSFTNAYDQNDCGPDDNTNCGLYKFGQGKLDWDEVIEPSGTLNTPTAESVDAASVDSDTAASSDTNTIPRTQLVLPASLASAEETIGDAISTVHAFDALGRNYIVDLSNRVTTTSGTVAIDRQLSTFLDRQTNARPSQQRLTFGGYEQAMSYDRNGNVKSAHLRAPLTADLSGTAFRFNRGGQSPGTPGSNKVAMVSYNGGTALTHSIDEAHGLSLSYALTNNWSVATTAWRGDNVRAQGSRGDTIRYTGASLAYSEGGYDLEIGSSVINESHGFLGAVGRSGLSTEDGSTLRLHRIQGGVTAGAWRGWAQYKRGSVSGEFGDSLINAVEADVEQIATGMHYSVNAETDLALVASTPLNAVNGEASLTLPQGVNRDGNVTFEQRDVAFDADSRPVRVEFGVNHRLDARSQVGVNVLNAPSGGTSGERTTAGLVTYSTRF